jgi:hypothetical protein
MKRSEPKIMVLVVIAECVVFCPLLVTVILCVKEII